MCRRPEILSIPEGGGALHFGYFHLGFPGKFFSVPTLLASCCPHIIQGFALWRPRGLGEGEEKAAGAAQRAGWDGLTAGAGGVCCQAPAESRLVIEDRTWLSLLPDVAVCTCPGSLGGECAGQPREHPVRPPLWAPGEQSWATASSQLRSATNQSEAGWAGSRERLLLRRGWRPSCQDGLRVF